jgi:hypothetical protein
LHLLQISGLTDWLHILGGGTNFSNFGAIVLAPLVQTPNYDWYKAAAAEEDDVVLV